MGKLGKLFGKKAENDQEVKKPAPRPEDITLLMSNADLLEGLPSPGEGFGLQFHVEKGEVQSFNKLPILIGRGEHNQIVLKDESVSTNHARVYFDERVGSICIEDNHSLNGISVNHFPTTKNILRDGDEIMAGNVVITFRDTGYINQSQ